jgi:pilus assembly protein CpaC
VRRVQTDVELEQGQSFAIAGLLDNRVTDQLNKIPGLANIPLFGKLFQSRSLNRNKSELLVVVTPELVQPIPAGSKLPGLNAPQPFLKDGGTAPPDGNPPATGRLPVESQIPWELTEAGVERNSPSNRVAGPPAGRVWPALSPASDASLRPSK